MSTAQNPVKFDELMADQIKEAITTRISAIFAAEKEKFNTKIKIPEKVQPNAN